MPQLDFSSYPMQIFWLVIFWLLTYLIVSKIFLPGMAGIFMGREAATKEALENAERMAEESSVLRKEMAAALDQAKAEAMALKQEAKIEAKRIIAAEVVDTESAINKHVGREIEKIKRLEQKVHQELPKVAEQLSVDIVKVLLNRHNNDKTLN